MVFVRAKPLLSFGAKPMLTPLVVRLLDLLLLQAASMTCWQCYRRPHLQLSSCNRCRPRRSEGTIEVRSGRKGRGTRRERLTSESIIGIVKLRVGCTSRPDGITNLVVLAPVMTNMSRCKTSIPAPTVALPVVSARPREASIELYLSLGKERGFIKYGLGLLSARPPMLHPSSRPERLRRLRAPAMGMS